MRIEILRSVMVSGEPVSAGSILDATPADAALLIGMNKAQLAPEPEPVPAPEPALICEAPKRPRKTIPTPTAEEA